MSLAESDGSSTVSVRYIRLMPSFCGSDRTASLDEPRPVATVCAADSS